MKAVYLTLLAAGLSLSAQGGKSSCTDAALSFTVTDNNPGMASDGNGSYLNGANGVIARLNCDGDSAELSGTRPVYLNLSLLVDGTAPSWTTSQAPVLFFNIPFGNYFFNAQPQAGSYSFTTYLKATMASPNTGYYFDMENPAGIASGLNAPDSGVNTSTCTTTAVNVTHYGAGTYQNNPGAPETWVVSPVSSPASCTGAVYAYNVGTLLKKNPHGNGQEIVGQFDLPFLIVIQRQ
jgi:hypothetical protein